MMEMPEPGQEFDIVVEISKYALSASRHVPRGMDEVYKPSLKLRYDGKRRDDGKKYDTHIFTLLSIDRVNLYGERAYISIGR